ncbi:LOW QUALITY PROTEIN: reticulocyte binding protein, putative, partial [Plasmodium relictum]
SEKLIDAIKEKGIIDNASSEIQSIEKLLMLHKLSSIMDNMRKNFQKAKEEEEIIKEKFSESEKIKKEILVDFQKAEELRDSLIEKLDDNSINTYIEEIRSINDLFATKIVSVSELLTIAEQYNGNCKLYYHSIERGKDKIEYLKIHDYNEEKKITDDVIEEINRYVEESGTYSNEADKFTIEARKNYELSCIYKEKMSNLLDESLLLGEKIKVEIKKNDVTDMLIEIRMIITINDIFATKIVSVNELLTIAEQYNGNCKLYHHSIERGKHKIEYLKIHDYNEEKKITDDVIEEINRYVKESGNYSNEADKFAIEARKNYELSCIYKEKMSDLLDESLLLGEKIKVEIKKNDVTDMLIEIKDGYYDIKNILEKLVRKLNKLKEKDVSIKEQDKEMAENKKSMDAFGLITVIKKNSDNFLAEIETLKQKASNILDNSESAFESTSTKNETNEEDISNKLKIMEDNLKNVLEALKKMESNKQILCTESSRIKEIENRVNSMESEIEIYEKSYEEGIISTKNETDEEDISSKLKIEEDNLKNVLQVLKKMESNKQILSTESSRIKEIENTVNSMESEMEIYEKSYEEGILEEIKRLADKEKENFELLMKSIKLKIDNTVNILEELKLEENNISHKFEDTKIKLNVIFDIFDKSYKNIERFALHITESTTTYIDIKEKREKAKIEKENIEKQKEEMEKLINIINNIKKNETLKLILYMKKELDKVNEKAEEEYSRMKMNIEYIKKNVESIKNSDSVSSALNELNNAKGKDSEIRQSKITYYSYKDEIDLIYSNMDKAVNFIDVNMETVSELENYESLKNTKDIILKIQENLGDVDEKVRESQSILIKAESIYKEVKLRDELKKKIKGTIKKIDEIFPMIQDSLNKYEKIKNISVDDENYDVIFKIGKDYESLKGLSNSYMAKLSEIDRELSINVIKSELDDSKFSLNDLENRIEASKRDEYSSEILEEVKCNIDRIINEINDKYSNVLEIDRSFDELLELGINYKLSFQSMVITSVNVEVSKDVLIIEKKQKDVASCIQYIKNCCDSITNDINTLNKSYNRDMLSGYKSSNIENASKILEEFKVKEEEAIKMSSAIQKLFLIMNKNKDVNKVDEYIQELKDIYENFQKEKIYINEIFRNINDSKLKEMEETSEKYIEIADSHKTIVEDQKEKFLSIKSKLKEIEDFLREKKENLHSIEFSDLEYIKKVNEIYEEIEHKVIDISELENDNNSENNKIIIYTEKISY